MILDIIVHRFGITEFASLTGVLCGLLLLNLLSCTCTCGFGIKVWN